jgi:hypothetical protein
MPREKQNMTILKRDGKKRRSIMNRRERNFFIMLGLFGREALRALSRNKLRSALSVIGITSALRQ